MFQIVVLEGRTREKLPCKITGVYFLVAKAQDWMLIYDRATVSFTEEHTNMS